MRSYRPRNARFELISARPAVCHGYGFHLFPTIKTIFHDSAALRRSRISTCVQCKDGTSMFRVEGAMEHRDSSESACTSLRMCVYCIFILHLQNPPHSPCSSSPAHATLFLLCLRMCDSMLLRIIEKVRCCTNRSRCPPRSIRRWCIRSTCEVCYIVFCPYTGVHIC
jgi:hypothetical protein